MSEAIFTCCQSRHASGVQCDHPQGHDGDHSHGVNSHDGRRWRDGEALVPLRTEALDLEVIEARARRSADAITGGGRFVAADALALVAELRALRAERDPAPHCPLCVARAGAHGRVVAAARGRRGPRVVTVDGGRTSQRRRRWLVLNAIAREWLADDRAAARGSER